MHSLFAKVCCGVGNEHSPSELFCGSYDIKEPQGGEVVSQLANFVIPPLTPLPTLLLNSTWCYRNQCSSLLPCHSRTGRQREGRNLGCSTDTQWMNILLLLIRSPIDARNQWFNKMKRRKENVCQLVLQRTPYGGKEVVLMQSEDAWEVAGVSFVDKLFCPGMEPVYRI